MARSSKGPFVDLSLKKRLPKQKKQTIESQ